MLRAMLSSAAGTGTSRLLGLVRDVAVASVLGAGQSSDAFYTAIRVPGVLRRFVADEGLSGALVPALARTEAGSGPRAAGALAGQALLLVIFASSLLSAAVMVWAPAAVAMVAPGFVDEPARLDLTVALVRIVGPFVVSVAVLSWAESLLNLRGHFLLPKLAPGAVSVLIAAASLSPLLPPSVSRPAFMAGAMVVGGFLQVVLCLPVLHRLWDAPRVGELLQGWAQLRRLCGELGKVALIGVVAQVNIIVVSRLASELPVGSVTWYWYGVRVTDVAQGVVAVAVGSVLLPPLATALASGLRETAGRLVQRVLVLLIGALVAPAVLLAALAEPIVAVLFQGGEFAHADTVETAGALRLLLPYMVALGLIQVGKKPLMADDRRGVQLAIGAAGVCLTWALGAHLSERYGVRGLCAGLSLSVALQGAVYLLLLRSGFRSSLALRPVVREALKVGLVSCIAAALAAQVAGLGSWPDGRIASNMAVLGAAMGVWGVVFCALGAVSRLTLVQFVRQRVRGAARG